MSLGLAVAWYYDYTMVKICNRSISYWQEMTYNLTLKFNGLHHTTKTTFIPLLHLGSLFQKLISLVKNANEVTKEGSLVDVFPQQYLINKGPYF